MRFMLSFNGSELTIDPNDDFYGKLSVSVEASDGNVRRTRNFVVKVTP